MGTTKTQQITEEIRKMIMTGRLQSGLHVEEKKMADMLGVSRTPIRDSFAMLSSEGLLEYFPNRGYVVRAYDIEGILDAFAVRATLEGMTCRLLALKPPAPAVFQELQRLINRGDEVLGGPNWDSELRHSWHTANAAFHITLADATGNEHLKNFTRKLRQFPLILDNRTPMRGGDDLEAFFVHESGRSANEQHKKILHLIRSGDAMRAENLMQEHVSTNADALRRAFGLEPKLSPIETPTEEETAPQLKRRRKRQA